MKIRKLGKINKSEEIIFFREFMWVNICVEFFSRTTTIGFRVRVM